MSKSSWPVTSNRIAAIAAASAAALAILFTYRRIRSLADPHSPPSSTSAVSPPALDSSSTVSSFPRLSTASHPTYSSSSSLPTHLHPSFPSSLSLAIHEDPNNEYLGSIVWEGGLALGLYFLTQHDGSGLDFLLESIRSRSSNHHFYSLSRNFLTGKRVLELGSGTGISGLTAAKLGAKAVIMTDIAEILPLLEENIKRNFPQSEWQPEQHKLVYKPPPSDGERREWSEKERVMVRLAEADLLLPKRTKQENTEKQQMNDSQNESQNPSSPINPDSDISLARGLTRPPYPDCEISTCELLWGEQQDKLDESELPEPLREPVDWIIAADVVYDAYSTQLDGLNNSSRLYSTLKYLTRRSPAPEILMTYTPRREEEKQFFELMSQDFCWQSIPACQLLPDHEIDERIVILHVHRSQAAAAPSVRESVHTKEMSSFLTEEQRRQEEIMKQKIEAKRAKKIKAQSDTA